MRLSREQKKIATAVGVAAGGALLIGGAMWLFSSKPTEKPPPEGVTPAQDRQIRADAEFILKYESSVTVLRDLLAKLNAVGYRDLAAEVSQRVKQLGG